MHMKVAQGGEKSLVIPNSDLADRHSKSLYRHGHNVFRLANSAHLEQAKRCLLDAAFVTLALSASEIIITLNLAEGQNLLFRFYSPLLVHSSPYFKTNQNYLLTWI